MKKSLRQMLLVGMSATMLAGVASPVIFAQEDNAEETSEQVEETSEEAATEEMSEESATEETAEEVDTEASEAQMGIEEAVAIFQEEYPESEIEEIDAELDLEENIYTIFVRGFDAEDNTYELELQWADGEVREQQFHEGWFNSVDTDVETTEDGADLDTEADPEADANLESEVTDEADVTDADLTDTELTDEEALEGETSEVETTEEPAEGELDEEQAYRALDFDNLVSVDEASDAALAAIGSGEIVHWNLSADTAEWWGLFGDEENENPVWTINIENTAEDTDEEVHVDAVTGEILNPEDIEETTEEAPADDAETTEEVVEDPAAEESAVEETTEDAE